MTTVKTVRGSGVMAGLRQTPLKTSTENLDETDMMMIMMMM